MPSAFGSAHTQGSSTGRIAPWNRSRNTASWRIVSAIAVVTLLVLTLIRMIALPVTLRNPWFEMALISILVIAFHLGEVLLDLPAAIVVGFCLYWIDRPEPSPQQPMTPGSRLMGPTRQTWPRVAPVR